MKNTQLLPSVKPNEPISSGFSIQEKSMTWRNVPDLQYKEIHLLASPSRIALRKNMTGTTTSTTPHTPDLTFSSRYPTVPSPVRPFYDHSIARNYKGSIKQNQKSSNVPHQVHIWFPQDISLLNEIKYYKQGQKTDRPQTNLMVFPLRLGGGLFWWKSGGVGKGDQLQMDKET